VCFLKTKNVTKSIKIDNNEGCSKPISPGGIHLFTKAEFVYLFLKTNFPVSKEKGSDINFP